MLQGVMAQGTNHQTSQYQNWTIIKQSAQCQLQLIKQKGNEAQGCTNRGTKDKSKTGCIDN